MTNEPVRFSLAELQSAVETIAIAQAHTGVAISALLNDPSGLSPDEREKLTLLVDRQTERVVELSKLLLGMSDGA